MQYLTSSSLFSRRQQNRTRRRSNNMNVSNNDSDADYSETEGDAEHRHAANGKFCTILYCIINCQINKLLLRVCISFSIRKFDITEFNPVEDAMQIYHIPRHRRRDDVQAQEVASITAS